jgi:2-oxo-hept-3-ene-1,7-dioate hydratase
MRTLLLFLASISAAFGCNDDPRVDVVATAWQLGQALPALDDLDLDTALCFQSQFMERMAQSLGPVVGYKVGVYTAGARETYTASAPVVGQLRQKMLVADGSAVAASAGISLVSEADFILVVNDAGINDVGTREEAYRHLRGFRPFVEVPDLNYARTVKPSLGQLVALNVNARLGVLGAEIPLQRTQAGFDGLANLTAEVTVKSAAEGVLRARGVARETLGDPLEIVLAARNSLKGQGIALKAGDLISIGTLTPPRPVKAGETLSVRYSVATATAGVTVPFVP